jgi:hypothetical protein
MAHLVSSLILNHMLDRVRYDISSFDDILKHKISLRDLRLVPIVLQRFAVSALSPSSTALTSSTEIY